MTRVLSLTAGAATALVLALQPDLAAARGFGGGFHGFGGGGFHGGFGGFHGGDFGGFHGGDFHGFHGNSSWHTLPGGDVAHTGDVGGPHGTVVGPEGAAHVGTAGGYVHGTAVGPGGAVHTGAYGTSYDSRYGGYYGAPAAAGWYGGGCWDCGTDGWGWGAAAAGVAAGAVVGSAVASSNETSAYNAGVVAGTAAAIGATYASLPVGCTFVQRGDYPYYQCGGPTPYWLAPAYGANGVYYRVVAAP